MISWGARSKGGHSSSHMLGIVDRGISLVQSPFIFIVNKIFRFRSYTHQAVFILVICMLFIYIYVISHLFLCVDFSFF